METPIADQVVPIVQQAIEKGKIAGAICNPLAFMAKHGFSIPQNTYKQTAWKQPARGGDNYTNYDGYVHTPKAVCDNNIVTANGSAALEFCQKKCSC